MLAHELGHVVRGDLWANWLLVVARTLHWFNPLAWRLMMLPSRRCQTPMESSFMSHEKEQWD